MFFFLGIWGRGYELITGVGETPHMKWVGMLVVSLRSVNFGFLVSLRVFWAKCHHI